MASRPRKTLKFSKGLQREDRGLNFPPVLGHIDASLAKSWAVCVPQRSSANTTSDSRGRDTGLEGLQSSAKTRSIADSQPHLDDPRAKNLNSNDIGVLDRAHGRSE